MKYYKRLKIYKASNVTFNPETMEAHSYRWWRFTAKIGKRLVFNNYMFSVSTSKHQSKVRQLLLDKSLTFVELPEGISSVGFESGIKLYQNRINKLNDLINKKGTRKAKNQERKSLVKFYQSKIKLIQSLEKQYSNDIRKSA